MSDLIWYVLCALVLGILVRPLLDRAWYELKHLRYEPWWPVRCAECRRWQRRERTRLAEHRVAGWVRLCTSCYEQYYHPKYGWCCEAPQHD